MESHICQRCGAAVTKRDAIYVCAYCRATYEDDAEERAAVTLQGLLDGIKIERLSAARKNLYDATHAQYPSKNVVIDAANAVLAIYPDDALAKVYLYSHEEPAYRLAELLPSLELTKPEADDVLSWVTRSLSAELVGPIHDFAERHYRDQELTAAMTQIEEEANKLFEGVYIPSLPRDVFLAYSSADMPQVIHILNLLEENGFTAFAAFRNLRHGKGAAGDYWSSLKEAMEACTCFVYISSKHSRAATCDALKREIPHLTVNLPKKPRIEFLLEDYDDRTPFLVKNTLKKAFPDQEYCRDEEDLLLRIQSIVEKAASPEEPTPIVQTIIMTNPAPEAPKPVETPTPALMEAKAEEPVVPAPQPAPAAPVQRLPETPRDQFQFDGSAIKQYIGRDEVVVIPAGTTQIQYAAFRYAKVKRVIVPEGVTFIDKMAFFGCGSLETVELPSSLKSLGEMAFTECANLTHITLPPHLEDLGEYAFQKSGIQAIEIPGCLKKVPHAAFYSCPSLRTVTIREGVEEIASHAFGRCPSLTTVRFPISLRELSSEVFDNCISLSEVILPPDIQAIGGTCFANCKALRRVEIPGTMKYLSKSVFGQCDSLREVVVHEGVEKICEGAFFYCKNLQSVTLPSTISQIDTNAFYGVPGTIHCPNESVKAMIERSVDEKWKLPATLVVD